MRCLRSLATDGDSDRIASSSRNATSFHTCRRTQRFSFASQITPARGKGKRCGAGSARLSEGSCPLFRCAFFVGVRAIQENTGGCWWAIRAWRSQFRRPQIARRKCQSIPGGIHGRRQISPSERLRLEDRGTELCLVAGLPGCG